MSELFDARVMAWAEASARMEAATKYRLDYRKKITDIEHPLPPDYHALVAEAQVFATMANTDTAVAFAQGDRLVEKIRAEEEASARAYDAFDDFVGQRKRAHAEASDE